MGGHVTFSNHQYYKTATRWAVEEWNEIGRNCKVDMSPLWNEPGIHLVPYPAQFAVPLFPNEHKEKCLRDLRERYSDQNGKLSKNATFEEWVLRNFGPAMNEAFFIPYTIKVWTLGVEEMSSNWVGERVAKLPKERLEELCAMSEDEVVMTPNGEKYWSLLVECARKPEDTTASEEEIKKATVAGLVRKGMIEEGNIVSLWSTTLNYGYPIPTPQRDEELARAHRELEKWSIYSRGRFGGWKYEVSNQDHCFLQGKEFIDRIVLGEPERMYKTCVDEFAEE
ncbi:unnamed protein product, partial [Mesorhabditis belari]|uniref:Uncharacterized protein n=1 Tax=Mesorhabditis belari TaxID=2138241 RepID=A0AAF3EQ40_9BILA